jgi:hypothetical protein
MAKKRTTTKKSGSKSNLKKNATFSNKHFALYMLVFALVGAFILWITFAAPPTKGGGTISGPVLLKDQNSDGLANYGDTITFNVATTSTDRPYVGLRCYQGTTFVFDGYVGYFDSYLFTKEFQLASQTWTGGAADCKARLFSYNKRGGETLLTTMSFHVNN